MTSKEKLQIARAEQMAEEQIITEWREREGEDALHQLREVNQHQSIKRGEVLEFYRDENGIAQARFRKETEQEADERASDWVEDNI
jgi:hypothetical protein